MRRKVSCRNCGSEGFRTGGSGWVTSRGRPVTATRTRRRKSAAASCRNLGSGCGGSTAETTIMSPRSSPPGNRLLSPWSSWTTILTTRRRLSAACSAAGAGCGTSGKRARCWRRSGPWVPTIGSGTLPERWTGRWKRGLTTCWKRWEESASTCPSTRMSWGGNVPGRTGARGRTARRS